MEFSRRGPATAAADDGVDGGRRFPDPSLHGDATLVMRDALLLQLQKDRLRQEIIVAELAKIERDMALHSASGQQPVPLPRHGMAAANVGRAKPVPFSDEFIMPKRQGPVGREHNANVDEDHDVEHRSVESKPGQPVMEGYTTECLKPRSCHAKAGQENAAFDEQKLPESSKTIPPKKTTSAMTWELTGITIPVKKPNSPWKWSCAVCQVRATSERNLREHCAGQRHQSNVEAIGLKAKTTAEPSPGTYQKPSSMKWSCSACANAICESDLEKHLTGKRHQQNIEALCNEGNCMARNVEPQEAKLHESKVAQHAEKPPLRWSCSICQANCTGESDLENHLQGRRHQAKIQALCEEGKNMARNSRSQEAKLHPKNVPQHAEKTTSRWSCSICQAICTCESDLENHLRGRRHQLNSQALRKEAKKVKNNPQQTAKNHEPPSDWSCSICQAKCNSESQYENHLKSRKHQQNTEALYREGEKNAKSEKVEKQKILNFCWVCNLQCNSEKMLAHHRGGKKHQAKLNAGK